MVTSECHFQGECQGTCPKCEAELKFLEKELHKRRQLGKAVAVAGISLGIASTFSACNTPQKQPNITTSSEQEIVQEMPEIEISYNKSKDIGEELLIIAGEVIDGEIPSKPPDEILPIEDDVEDTSDFPDF